MSIPSQLPSGRAIPSASAQHAFSLVEVLIAVAILAILVALVAQITQSGTDLITGDRQHLEADSQARAVFDRIAMDVAQMVRGDNIDSVFRKENGNDAMFFYSGAPGFYDDSITAGHRSPLSLVGYRIGSDRRIERLGKGLAWDGAGRGITFLTYASNTNTTALPGSEIEGAWPNAVASNSGDPDYHVLAPGVFRFELCFLKKDGSYAAELAAEETLSDVAALVVAIAVLDERSRGIIDDPGRLPDALADVAASDLAAQPPRLMGHIWQDKVLSGSFANAAGIPERAASQVRIYQRTFPINTP